MDELLDEWEEVIIRKSVRSSDSARSVIEAVKMNFGRYRIDGMLYRGQVSDDLSPDPGDRLHAAACIHGGVDVLLTRNIKDFQAPSIAQAGVQVMTSDVFLSGLLSRHCQAVVKSFVRAADSKRNPPKTSLELAATIAHAGAPRFAERLRPHLAK